MSVSMAETESKNFENPAYEVGEDPAGAGMRRATFAPAPTREVDKRELFCIIFTVYMSKLKVRCQMACCAPFWSFRDTWIILCMRSRNKVHAKLPVPARFVSPSPIITDSPNALICDDCKDL